MIQYALTDSANIFWSLSMYDNTILVATPAVGNTRTLPNSVIVSGSNGYNYQMTFVQDAIGGRSISFDSNFKVIGSFDLEPNKRTLITVVKQDGEADVILTPLTTLGTVGVLSVDNLIVGTLLKTANYVMTNNDSNILVDASAGDVTITLPPIINGAGVSISKVDSSLNKVIIDGYLSETINGTLTVSITSQYDSVSLLGYGSSWHIT